MKHTPGLKYRNPIFSIIQQSPSIRTIKFVKKFFHSNQEPVNYRISFPYVIFILPHQKNRFKQITPHLPLRVYFRKETLTRLDDSLYMPWLPNLDGGQQACLFSDHEQGGRYHTKTWPDYKSFCEETIALFWQSTFNMDMSGGLALYRTSIYQLAQYHKDYWQQWQYHFATNVNNFTRHEPIFNVLEG